MNKILSIVLSTVVFTLGAVNQKRGGGHLHMVVYMYTGFTGAKQT